MKKLISLFVPLMALFLTLAPQTAKADYVDDNLTQPLTIEMPTDGVTASFKIYFAGATSSSSSTKVTTNLQYRLSSNGGAWGAWTNVLTSGTTTYKGVASAAPGATTLGGGSSPYKKMESSVERCQSRRIQQEQFLLFLYQSGIRCFHTQYNCFRKCYVSDCRL